MSYLDYLRLLSSHYFLPTFKELTQLIALFFLLPWDIGMYGEVKDSKWEGTHTVRDKWYLMKKLNW